MLLVCVRRLPPCMAVFLALLALTLPVSAHVADVRHPDPGCLRSQCAHDPLYRSFTNPHLSALASSFCSSFIQSTLRAEATLTQTHIISSTERSSVTATATVTETSVIAAVETDTTTSTTLETITVDVYTTITGTTSVPTTVATDVITLPVATETDTVTVATSSTTTLVTATTITIIGRGYPNSALDQWIHNHRRGELSSACSCILTKAPPAKTIYTGTTTYTTAKVVVTDITSTVTATSTFDVSSTSTSTTETGVVATQLTSQTNVITVPTTTTVEVPATETTTLDITVTTTNDVTVTTTISATATATTTCCECEPPFRLQVSGSPANGQYLTLASSSLLNDEVLEFGNSSVASTFTLDSQCRLITGGYYSAVGPGDFYDVIREDTSGNYPLLCSVQDGGLSCLDDAGQGIGNNQFAYNALGYLAFQTSNSNDPNTLTLNVLPV